MPRADGYKGVNANGVRRNGRLDDQGRKRRRKQLVVQHSRGEYDMVPNDAAVAHLHYLMKYMTLREVSRRSGLTTASLDSHAYPGPSRAHKTILKGTEAHILAVRTYPGEITYEERALGIMRILRGLVAKGFTMEALAPLMGRSHFTLQRQARRPDKQLPQDYYDTVVRVAEKLETVDPFTLSSQHSARYTRTHALNRGWAPLGCWDLDTIHRDDVEANWTGQCGTPNGYRIHLREEIPVCEMCRRAYHIHRKYPLLAELMGIVKLGQNAVELARGARERGK